MCHETNWALNFIKTTNRLFLHTPGSDRIGSDLIGSDGIGSDGMGSDWIGSKLSLEKGETKC